MYDYVEIEKIKEFIQSLGFNLGPVTIEEDEPYLKIIIEFNKIKRIEDGTERDKICG